MTTAEYIDACRRRTKELLKIAKGTYDAEERSALERMIREFEKLAVQAGSRRRKAAKLRVGSSKGNRSLSAAGTVAPASNRQY
jgi:hypothetical protein